MKSVLLLVALLASVAALSLAASASSYSLQSTGSPGTTATPFTYASYGASGSKITVPWRTVSESPAYRAYDQYVCVTPRLWTIRYGSTPTWAQNSSATNCAWIRGAASAVDVNGVDFTGLVPYAGYSVDIRVTWQLSNGYTIGTQTYDYNVVNDYRCNVGAPRCIIGMTTWGGGAFVQFDW